MLKDKFDKLLETAFKRRRITEIKSSDMEIILRMIYSRYGGSSGHSKIINKIKTEYGRNKIIFVTDYDLLRLVKSAVYVDKASGVIMVNMADSIEPNKEVLSSVKDIKDIYYLLAKGVLYKNFMTNNKVYSSTVVGTVVGLYVSLFKSFVSRATKYQFIDDSYSKEIEMSIVISITMFLTKRDESFASIIATRYFTNKDRNYDLRELNKLITSTIADESYGTTIVGIVDTLNDILPNQINANTFYQYMIATLPSAILAIEDYKWFCAEIYSMNLSSLGIGRALTKRYERPIEELMIEVNKII